MWVSFQSSFLIVRLVEQEGWSDCPLTLFAKSCNRCVNPGAPEPPLQETLVALMTAGCRITARRR